jgi:hypothetical protein
MPYIKSSERPRLDSLIEDLLEKVPETSGKGDINYIVSRMVHRWIEEEIVFHGKSYAVVSQGYDVLMEAAAEYYRQVLAKYEDQKRLENGGVSNLDAINMEDVR